jgi:serine/threonine protein kinase/dipeptidyl aminopeptidase/acylaminoacyl peptidase
MKAVMSLDAGTNLGRYELLEHAGAGGMGEVYRARDPKLDRIVALKVLPYDVAHDELRMQRFVQEAKTASALNHPNIITIYEIDHAGETQFIAAEFIEGVTLREKMRGGALPVIAALDVAVQVASALAAAHEAGIAHRDIKPENVMVRRDSIVKVLDFGLAKPTEHAPSNVDTEAATLMLVHTSPGVVMGTINYMSPEQARGLALDARTDIWSLGAVLYEMLAGKPPFTGATSSDILVAVLDREPAPLTDAPPELQRIVRKALRKDREERYQTVKDMLVDLRELKHELEFQAKLERSMTPDSGQTLKVNTGQTLLHDTDAPNGGTATISAAHTVSSAEYIVGQIKQHKRGAVVTLFALGALLVFGSLTVNRFFHRAEPKPLRAAAQPTKHTRLTTQGRVLEAVISPDGQFVAYTAKEGAQQALYVRQVVANSNVAVVPPGDGFLGSLAFSPDGNFIYYLRSEPKNPVNDLYQAPTLGGAPRKLINDIDSAISFAPSGREFAFLRHYPDSKDAALIIANADGTGERKLAVRHSPATYFFGPAWSPDGQTIAVFAGNSDNQTRELLAINVADGKETGLGRQKWRTVRKLAWLKDGSELLLNAVDQPSSPLQLWRISYPGGEVLNATNDFNNYFGASVTDDGASLVTVQSTKNPNLWVAPDGDAKNARQLLSANGTAFYGLSWTPDGRIVYSSNAGGNRDIWIMNADGSQQRQLTNDAFVNYQPAVTPDGRYVVFVSERAGRPNLWRMNLDGGNPTQITNGSGEHNPAVTPDSRSIIYVSATVPTTHLWKVPLEGGQPVEITNKMSNMPAISPDGKSIACAYWDEQLNSKISLALLSINGGAPIRTFEQQPEAWRWSPDSRSLIYVDNTQGFSNLMRLPLENGKPKPVTDFQSDWIFGFDYSRDGKQLAFLRGNVINDVVLISNFR